MNISQLRALLKRTPKPADPPGVTVPAWLVSSAKLASWVAMCSLVYFLWLFSLDAAGDQSTALEITHAGFWTGAVSFWFPLVFGFILISFGIPFLGKIIIPIFVSLSWRDNLWPKTWSLVLVMAASFVIISGTISVQGHAIVEHGRDGAVAVAQVQQGRAVLQAQIDAKQQELRDMMNNSNAYLAQAASVGAAEWERSYVAQARAINDPQLARIERAMGAARSADQARADLTVLRAQLAAQPVEAAVSERVESAHTSAMQGFLDWLVTARAILLAVVMDVVCLLMPWIALRLEQTRNRQLAQADFRSDDVDEAHMIPDLRKEAPVAAKPPEPMKQRVINAETGEEELFVPGYFRRTGKRKKNTKGQVVEEINTAPESVEDERGVVDARSGFTPAEMAMSGAMPEEIEPPAPVEPEPAPAEPEPAPTIEPAPEMALTQAELEALFGAPQDLTETALPDGEGVLVTGPEVYGPPAPAQPRKMEDA